MASFTFKPLQQTQLQLYSFSHCKYSSTLNTFKFNIPFYTPEEYKFKLQLGIRCAAHSKTRLSGDRDVDTGPNADFVSGFSSFCDIRKRACPKSLGPNHTGADEPIIERRVILKDRHSKIGLNSKIRKEVGKAGVSSTRFKGNQSSRFSNGVEVEPKRKRTKKAKEDSPETTLRVGLDMCSKRGDVMGALKLYVLSRKEGVPFGQYHYAVLLYLCSSAATGMVQPAKSGNGSRSLSTGDSLHDSSAVGSELLSESKFSEQNQKGQIVMEHLEKIEFSTENCPQTLDALVESMKKNAEYVSSSTDGGSKGYGIQVSEYVKGVALERGFELYKQIRLEKVPMNEAIFTSVARMAMAFSDGEMAFDTVKQMKEYGLSPRLRSYGPALAIFCSNGDVESAFEVEQHMLEHGVYPEEPELEALLKVSIEAGKSDKVYYVLHKLRTSVRQVLPTTADLIERWFRSKVASRVGKRKWDQEMIIQAMENGGGGWHGKGWLGNGKWVISRSPVGADGLCKCCGENLVTIDLDPAETESFANSVASIASQRETNSSFQKFQKWLEYYGPFEAVVDAANVGLYSQRRFKPSKVNAVANGIRQMLPSRKWPLIVLHNRRISGEKMDEPFNRSLIEKWKNADALYATPTGSNDDWYWLYAAIKYRCLIVTNDEMRDHLFQLLGNDFFPRWKERHQVRFSFTETGPAFRMPPPCSVVIQESEKGHWHIPIISESENEDERIWLCCRRANSSLTGQNSSDIQKESNQKKGETRMGFEAKCPVEPTLVCEDEHGHNQEELEELSNTSVVIPSVFKNRTSVLPALEIAEKLGDCLIDFQI
ncbi:hypothetical protein CASFOL_013803 [Castilleja foliolosa]|uniref:ribonuclease P n=1 Tax=Castilleja foliolosa TaxID=1961234 RepID=A0ABD3DL17_9LAMI